MILKKSLLHFLIVLFFIVSCKKENDIRSYDFKALGSSAQDILSSSKFKTLKIQVSYADEFEPEISVFDSLRTFLNKLVNKPNGILILKKTLKKRRKSEYNLSEIVSLEKENRSIFTKDNILTVHVLIVDGYFTDYSILGNSYWNTSICIFGTGLKDNSGGFNQMSRKNLLTTLLEHEFGHLMGLVNQGTTMQNNHCDCLNGAHCINPKCIMYHINTDYYLDSSLIGKIPKLDSNCLADLRANGGK